jgi:hypothetical protein
MQILSIVISAVYTWDERNIDGAITLLNDMMSELYEK